MRSIYTLLLTLALSSLAAAQSLDCKLAQSPREQAICAGTRLSALDTEIATAYKSLRDELSPQSSALVESDQREWSQWIDLVCPAQGKGTYDLSHCLQDHYAARARDFKKTVHLGTAIIFSRAHFLYKSGGQLQQASVSRVPWLRLRVAPLAPDRSQDR